MAPVDDGVWSVATGLRPARCLPGLVEPVLVVVVVVVVVDSTSVVVCSGGG